MKKIITKLACSFFLVIAINAIAIAQFGPGIKWQKCLGGTGSDRANDVVLTPDGGFIIVGFSTSNNGDVTGHHAGDSTDAWIAKLDGSGNLQWQKSIGGSGFDEFKAVVRTSDNNYMCFGSTTSNDGDVSGNHGKSDFWMVKITPAGVVLWSKCYGGTMAETAANGIQLTDGGYVIIGSNYSNDGDVSGFHGTVGHGNDIWFVKTDGSGTILWQKDYGTSEGGLETASGIVEDITDGNIIATVQPTGQTGDFYVPNQVNSYLIKVDKNNGNFIYKTNTGCRATETSAIIATSRGYITLFNASTYAPACYQLTSTIVAFKTNLINTWPGTIVSPNECLNSTGDYNVASHFADAHGIAAISDSTFIGAGYWFNKGVNTSPIGSYGGGRYGGIDAGVGLGRLMPSPGSTLAFKKFGGSQSDEFLSVKVLPGGNEYVAVGYTNSNDFDVSGNHGGSDCWVVRLVGSNTISGNVFLDNNGNGIKDAGEPAFNKATVRSQKAGFTQKAIPYNGFYINDLDTGTYVTTMSFNKPYYTVTPTSKTSVFAAYQNTETLDFAVQPIPGKRDYAIAATGLTSARAGFVMTYSITYNNYGTDTMINKNVTFIMDKHTKYKTSSAPITSSSGDTLRWNIASLLPGGSGGIGVTVRVDSIQYFPSSPSSQVVLGRFYIDDTGDVAPADNSVQVLRNVTGSYDPNDKQEANNGVIAPGDISSGKYLVYTIRFQNTGNDTAFNVVVKDSLETKVDWNTFEMIDASHPYQLNIQNERYCVWSFNNINLVDSLHNEPLSHGYITYRIKPLSTLAVGDTVHNKASIYFDFNPAVNTNMQETIVKVLAPPSPAVSGLQSEYCSGAGIQKGKILNLPDATSGITATVKLDNTTLTIGSDSTFSIDAGVLAAGVHTVIAVFANATGSDTVRVNINIESSVTPDVSVTANLTNIINNTDVVTVTAANAAGGGSSPLYTFAKDRAFTNIVQAEGSSNQYAVNVASLPMGDNWIYVKMKTSATCYTAQTNVDSIKLYKLLIPNQPVITGIGTTYCGTASAQKGKITNIPSTDYLSTNTVKLDGTTTLTIAADSTFSITPSALTAGNHSVVITFTNASGSKNATVNFTVTQAVNPDVNVSANITTVVNLTDNVVITATNASGGGTAPLYTFAKDKAMTNIMQAEGISNTLTVQPNTLVVGSNWFYVRMKTSDACFSAQTNIDSIRIDRSSVTGLIDLDNPTQVINVYPNPFKQSISIGGLNASKSYTITITNMNGQQLYSQQVSGHGSVTINRAILPGGNYWISIYDVKKKRMIGTVPLIKE